RMGRLARALLGSLPGEGHAPAVVSAAVNEPEARGAHRENLTAEETPPLHQIAVHQRAVRRALVAHVVLPVGEPDRAVQPRDEAVVGALELVLGPATDREVVADRDPLAFRRERIIPESD